MMTSAMRWLALWMVVGLLAGCGNTGSNSAPLNSATAAQFPTINSGPIDQTPPATSGRDVMATTTVAPAGSSTAVATPASTTAAETHGTASTGDTATSTAATTVATTSGTASSAATASSTASSAATASGTTGSAATASGTAVAAVTAGTSGTLTVMTHDSFSLSKAVVAQFEQTNGVKVQFLKAGDAGAALNKAILAKNNPLADVFFGVDNTFLSRALAADIFEAYRPQGAQAISPELQLDPQSRLVPIDYGFVNINYDLAAFGPGKLPVPQTLQDLTKPEYKGKLVVENPATSSTGLAFLLATIATFGESGSYTWRNYWQDLHKNDVQIVDGWDTAYNKNFSGSAGKGPQPLVVSYATSPAAEVDFSGGKLTSPPTGNLLPAKGAFRQIEFAGILKGSKQPALARKWLDFMVSPTVQQDIMPQMVVYPAVSGIKLPDVYLKYAPVPQQPAVIEPAVIAQQRDQWLQQWSTAVGQ